ncbi:MAG TPA: hypothetical protein VMA71_01535 [Alloacidobacterium sp.]|nr:hypothetical protein [Alloacidobacterium sp.]
MARSLQALSAGVLFFLGMLAVRTFSTPHAVNALADVYSALTPEPKIILSPLGLDLKKLFESYPLVFAFLAGLYRGFTFVEVLAWLERKRVRNNVMVPIPGPYGFDPLNPPILANKIDGEVVRIVERPLTWKGPERNRDRKAAWDALSRLVFDMPAGARRRRGFRLLHREFEAFRWTIVVGRSSAGKTRLAMEFLRNISRWEDLTGPEKKPLLARALIRFGAWRRRILWYCPERDDPWDAGWATDAQNSQPEAGPPSRRFLNHLEEWKPHRPSVLLVDDQRHNILQAIVRELSARAHEFRYPVRVIAVSQTLPAWVEMPKEKHTASRSQQIKESPDPYPQIVILGPGSGFSRKEILEVAHEDFYPLRDWEEDEAGKLHLDAVENLTEGNPLLVELSLHAMANGNPIERMTVDELFEQRAVSILESLRRFGLPRTALRKLASAALAGPQRLSPEAHHRFWKGFEDEDEILSRCFNLGKSGGEMDGQRVMSLPCVRPNRVGDAFVRLVLHECCAEGDMPKAHQEEVVQEAWDLIPSGVMGAIERNGAHIDDLGYWLRTVPVQDEKRDHAALALAYATAAAHTLKGRPAPTYSTIDTLTLAKQEFSTVSGSKALDLLPAIYALLDVEGGLVRPYFQAVECCFTAALARILDDERVDPGTSEWVRIAKMYVEQHEANWNRSHIYSEIWDSIAETALKFARRFDSVLSKARADASLAIWRARVWRVATFYAGTQPDRDRMEAALKLVDEIAAEAASSAGVQSPEAAEYALERAIARRNTAHWIGQKADGERTVIELERAVEEIAKAFKNGASFQLELARIKLFKCMNKGLFADFDREGGTGSDARPKCEQVAIELEKVCAPFRGNKDFEQVRAEAWMVVCDCKANALDESFIMDFRKIEEAAEKFPRERDFSLIRCKFLNILCNWNAEKGIAVFEPAFSSAMAICDQFGGDEEFEVERAKGLAMYSRCLVLNDDARCLDIEKQVASIWSVFYMIEFDFQAALARANVCRFYSRFGNNDECEKAAAAVEEITCRHLYEPAFQLQLATTRAYLCRWKGTRDDLDGAVEEAMFIDGIAADFASDSFVMQRLAGEQALAWCAVAHTARRMHRDRQRRQAVEKIYALDARFPQSKAVRSHADEWRQNRPIEH